MELSTMKKILSAFDSAGITVYDAITDTPTHFNNCANSFNILDEAEETIYNFRGRIGIIEPFNDPIIVSSANLVDVHEIKFGGTIDQIRKFIEAYGIKLSDEQNEILVNIKGANYNLKPESGDYLLSFDYLSEDELAALNPEARKEYERLKTEYETAKKEANKLQNPVQVTVS